MCAGNAHNKMFNQLLQKMQQLVKQLLVTLKVVVAFFATTIVTPSDV